MTPSSTSTNSGTNADAATTMAWKNDALAALGTIATRYAKVRQQAIDATKACEATKRCKSPAQDRNDMVHESRHRAQQTQEHTEKREGTEKGEMKHRRARTAARCSTHSAEGASYQRKPTAEKPKQQRTQKERGVGGKNGHSVAARGRDHGFGNDNEAGGLRAQEGHSHRKNRAQRSNEGKRQTGRKAVAQPDNGEREVPRKKNTLLSRTCGGCRADGAEHPAHVTRKSEDMLRKHRTRMADRESRSGTGCARKARQSKVTAQTEGTAGWAARARTQRAKEETTTPGRDSQGRASHRREETTGGHGPRREQKNKRGACRQQPEQRQAKGTAKDSAHETSRHMRVAARAGTTTASTIAERKNTKKK
ncbi:hypothetical protein ERJ75_000685000 [Trypanosoma vivax]|nr:hypothetical protein ERJ75_000685000 [Trypanosoma vivax]